MRPVNDQIFQAAWPPGYKPLLPRHTDKVVSVALAIFANWYAPHLLATTIACTLAFWAIRYVSRVMIHPAATFLQSSEFLAQANYCRSFWEHRSEFEIVHMRTPDGITLEGGFAGHLPAEGAVIYVCGNGESYETSGSIATQFLQKAYPNISVLAFNYRGVIRSKGTSSPDALPLDAYTAFEFLVQKGYDPARIVFLGKSLGGAAATVAAEYAQAKHPGVPINVINVHSFSNLPTEVRHILGNSVFGVVASLVVKYVFGWSLDAASSWRKLNNPNNTVIHHELDQVIPLPASLFSAPDLPGEKILKTDQSNERNFDYHNSNPLDTHVSDAVARMLNPTPSAVAVNG